MKKFGLFIKLDKCAMKLAYDFNLPNDQIFKNKYQMPNIHELMMRYRSPTKIKARYGLALSTYELRLKKTKKLVSHWIEMHTKAFKNLKSKL